MIDTNVSQKNTKKADLIKSIAIFKDEPWYAEICMFNDIGLCRTKSENLDNLFCALFSLGYELIVVKRHEVLYICQKSKLERKDDLQCKKPSRTH